MNTLYENIDSIIIIVYCILIGIVAAFAISLITRSIYGKFVDALIRGEANSKDKAKTFSELGLKCNFLIVTALSRKTILSSLISCDNKEQEAEKRRFYILPEHQVKAQALYGIEKLSPLTVVIAIILLAAIFVFFQYAVPKLFN